MTSATWKRQFYRLAVLTSVSAMMVGASGRTLRADDDEESDRRIVGAWAVRVTLRNCDTNAPMGSFTSIVAFHRGGTLTESPGSLAFQLGQRSEGHGVWQQLNGRTFSQDVIALILFDSPPNLPGTPTFDPSKPVSPGFTAGWQTISHRVRLTGQDSFESSGTTEFFNSSGQSYRTGCSSAVGQRFGDRSDLDR
jgi:hypothetical protein